MKIKEAAISFPDCELFYLQNSQIIELDCKSNSGEKKAACKKLDCILNSTFILYMAQQILAAAGYYCLTSSMTN